MFTLMRPSMYGAYHRVRVVGRSGPGETVDVAGDVCETGDLLAEGVDFRRGWAARAFWAPLRRRRRSTRKAA